MDPSKVTLPPMKDLTIDNITENTLLINSQCDDARMKFVLERLVVHVHDFARETRLSHDEWMKGLMFMTAVGQICSDVRQEFILLSDVLGLSLLVDSISNPKTSDSTEGSVLGPFHTSDAADMVHGDAMSHDPAGEPCLVIARVKDRAGNPIEGVKIDIWETDSSGRYDVQYADREGPEGRCVMKSDKTGAFWFKAIKPVPYPIPHDGPVGNLLLKLRRHPYRPSHMHFMFQKDGFDNLITALYLRNDPYEASDAVFGVKQSLIIDFVPCDENTSERYGVERGTATLRHDFVLMTEQESMDLRAERSKEAFGKLGMNAKFLNGLPVPDVD